MSRIVRRYGSARSRRPSVVIHLTNNDYLVRGNYTEGMRSDDLLTGPAAVTPAVAAAILLDERLDPLVARLREAIAARRCELARSLAGDLADAAGQLERALRGDPVEP